MSITDTAYETALSDEAFLNARRRDLLSRLDSYREQLEELSKAVVELSFGGGVPDGGDDDGFGEGDPLGMERDRVLALVGRVQRGTADAWAALDRLDNGSYGTCQACQQPIASARLEALPHTTHCISCKSASPLQLR